MYDIVLGQNNETLEKYRKQFILIVNIANECGFASQLAELEALHSDAQLNCSVIAFPCNQFGKQQTLPDEQMRSW